MPGIVEKYHRLPGAVRAAFWFTVCNFSLKGISFVCMPLYTRLLPTEEYGAMSLLTSYDLVFTVLATFEIYLGAFQRGMLEFRDDVRLFEKSVVLTSNAITAAFAFVVLLFSRQFVGFTGIPIGLFGLMALQYVVSTPYQCWLNRKRFDFDYKPAVAVTLAMALLANFVPVLTVQLVGRTALVKVSTTVIVNILFCLSFWVRDFDPAGIVRHADEVRRHVRFALSYQFPLVFHSLSYYVLNQSDRVMISMFEDKRSVALYSVAYSLANVVVLVQSSLNQVLRPWRLKKLDECAYDEMRGMTSVIVALVGCVISCFMLMVPEVFRFLFDERYHVALAVMPPVTASVFFLFLYTVFVDVESYYKRTDYIAYVSMACAALNIVLNYVGLQVSGYVVCAYTTLAGYVLMAVLHYLLMVRTCRLEGVPVPVDSRLLLLLTAAFSCAFALAGSLYGTVAPRYVVLAAVALAVVVRRGELLGIAKSLRQRV